MLVNSKYLEELMEHVIRCVTHELLTNGGCLQWSGISLKVHVFWFVLG